MKSERRKKLELLLASLLLLITGCSASRVVQRGEENGEKSEERTIGSFTGIHLMSVADIHFSQGEKVTLRIFGAASDVDQTMTETKDEELRIYSKQKNGTQSARVRIELTAPDLKAVRISGVGNVTIDRPITCEELNLKLSGVGSIRIDQLACTHLTGTLSGVGDFYLVGTCGSADLNMSGVGTIDCNGLTGDLRVNSSGVGKVKYKKRSQQGKKKDGLQNRDLVL